jgi:diguanylate cyclase (GGDEF)-like protein
MFISLTSRIAAVGTLVVIALLALGAGMFDASRQSRESFVWVRHSSNVLGGFTETLGGIRDAESGLRGYVLTRDPFYGGAIDRLVDDSLSGFGSLVELTKDNPEQSKRLREFGLILDERVLRARQTLALARSGDFEQAEANLTHSRNQELIEAMVDASDRFLAEERLLRDRRVDAMNERVAWSQRLTLIGMPMFALIVVLLSYVLIRNIRRPIEVINQAMDRLGAGDLSSRLDSKMGSREFNRLARGYNQMVDRLEEAFEQRQRNKEELNRVHAELLESTNVLKARGEVIELLGGMAHRMQAARTEAELARVIQSFVPRVLRGMSGVLFAHNNSRNLLVPLAAWGEFEHGPVPFAPDQCWALRRGQSHFMTAPDLDIRCEHVQAEVEAYHCEPLLASGEVIGVLYLVGTVDEECQFRLNVLVENIASAMVNHQLQRDLKEQTIRDPLTGRFNRRYMEEALALEISRAVRSNEPLSVVMCDIDHFKRFNDEFGHDAGDLVLQAVGHELGNRFRDGDIVCRFGGEEFVIIAPGSTPEDLRNRLDIVRSAISALNLRHNDQPLGNLTMSFGVARWRGVGDQDRAGQQVLKAADEALYRAKREGRDRVVLAETAASA